MAKIPAPTEGSRRDMYAFARGGHATASAEGFPTDRIEAAVQAEAKRIEAWNHTDNHRACLDRTRRTDSLCIHQVDGLANLFARDRIQVQDAHVQALVAALHEVYRQLDGLRNGPGTPTKTEYRDVCAMLLTTVGNAMKAAGEDA